MSCVAFTNGEKEIPNELVQVQGQRKDSLESDVKPETSPAHTMLKGFYRRHTKKRT